jgi:hypothetical protein
MMIGTVLGASRHNTLCVLIAELPVQAQAGKPGRACPLSETKPVGQYHCVRIS